MQKRTFTDQMGRIVSVPYPPQRIISLVPSQTELLFDLGLGREVVGITKFCIHPNDKFKSTAKVGGTKNLNLQKIRSLSPDLIIGNKEENEQDQIEELSKEFPVWMSDIHVLDDALAMINHIGELSCREKEARKITLEISSAFASLAENNLHKLKVIYIIWKDPYMLAGKNTFIDDILNRGGFENVVSLDRYPEINVQQIQELEPEMIFLSSEPFPFKDIHLKEMKNICPDSFVIIVDGEMFSWYGSRLLQTPLYLKSLVARAKSHS